MLKAAAWVLFFAGGLFAQDHVGKPVPEYITGDECLFCHRVKVADTWQQNPHAQTVRPLNVDADKHGFPADVTTVLGARTHFRGLKQDGYGKFDLLSPDNKSWDKEKFANRCAGCHTTAVDPATKAFSAVALDCYTCHGAVPQEHPNDTTLVWLSKKHTHDAVLMTSLCAQCHLRGGKSRSSGLPYANNFVAGDNLFKDFEIDWKQADNPDLNPGDRHIYINAREVVEKGGTVTCMSCHQVHGDSSRKHRLVLTSAICQECHNATGPKKDVKKYAVHSTLCEYQIRPAQLTMDNGWQASADAWIADMGEHGDFGRRYVLDPVMLPRALMRSPKTALDVGCGEGRFCRMLKPHGVDVTGMDPTPALISAARACDPDGAHLQAGAERLPFGDETFDLVVSYLSLIDIPDIQAAIPEMARVLNPGGALLIANINSFNSAGSDTGWIKDNAGQRLYYPIDNYLQERSIWSDYRGIRIRNHHRPMSTYMRLLLDAGLRLTYFDEPEPSAHASKSRAASYRRAPWFLVMEWVKPA